MFTIPESTLTITRNAYFNEFSLNKPRNSNYRLHKWIVQMKFNMGTLELDNHYQSFWQLIDRSI